MSRNMAKNGGQQMGKEANYSAIVDSLTTIFGQAMERDAIITIVESCDGDQACAADVLLHMTGHDKPQCSTSQATTSNYQQPQKPLSYCNVTKAPGTSFKQVTSLVQKDNAPASWSEHLRRIIYYHNKGYRTLIMLRGLPGSGKTYLAHQIMEMTIGPGDNVYKHHVFSSDDFFIVNGKYIYNKERLSGAHDWNKKRVQSHLLQGRSPVIVDNTNVKYWEMEWYARAGVSEGYFIEIIEPNTPWAWKINTLCWNNKHNVPYQTIIRMSEKFDPPISGQEYIRKFNIQYPSDKQPPVLRCIPIIEKNELPSHIQVVSNQDDTPAEHHQQIPNLPSLQTGNTIVDNATENSGSSESNEGINLDEAKDDGASSKSNEGIDLDEAKDDGGSSKSNKGINLDEAENDGGSSESNEGIDLKKYAVVAKKIEEYETIDIEWEKGGHWDDKSAQSSDKKSPQRGPRPQRNKEQLFPTVNEFQDWSNLIPPWQQNIPTVTETEPIPVETKSSSTCIEIGDTDHYNSNYKVVMGTPRDINFNYMPPMKENHNYKMFDQSTTTNDDFFDSVQEKNEEKLFRKFRNMFRTIPRNDLRDIFDKCRGDVSWAVEMVIEGIPLREDVGDYVASDLELSDQEEGESCTSCSVNPSVTANEIVEENKEAVANSPRRGKKDKTISESSLGLKRQIESNIVIPDKFYSNHIIRIRKGLNPAQKSNPEGEGTSKVPCDDSFETANETVVNPDDENVTLNLGREFVQNLDRLFGRGEGNWDDNNIMPLVTMPMSLLNQINALWLESLSYQEESQAAYSKLMLKQDEEFARQLAEKEEELNRSGQEPVVPDLKEIMAMDLAHTLYQREVAQWKNRAPKDWAAKLTMEKLVNLFRDIPEETLCEMLMAHENCFRATVETLLISTGQSAVLEQENGLNKFVMEKEMERQAKVIEAEKKKQLENAEWPVLTNLENVDMETVQSYRNEANVQMLWRNANYEHAQQCVDRGMTQIAEIHCHVASVHKRLFEKANNLAAAALLHVNQANQDKNTLDLHYLYVSEALQTLDLYLDHHIQILQAQGSQGLKPCELYIITGRGLHSDRGPKIKPAVKKRLLQRGFTVNELNPGLVSIKVTKLSKMTHQLQK